jgi:hypothetical protein
MEIKMDFGEIRHVKLLVKNIKNEEFAILSAKYELINEFSVNPEDSGEANIYEHTMDVVISPKKRAMYKLKYIYQIGDETLIDVVKVQVM